MAEATIEHALTLIASRADEEMRKLASAIEHREVRSFSNLFANLYGYVLLLKNLNEDFDLPGQWPGAIKEMWNEMEYLRELSNEIARKAMR